jgi:hypothetical protein
MNFTNFVYLSISIALVFYFMGAGPMVQLYNQQGGGFLKLSCPADNLAYGSISNATGTYTNPPSACTNTFFAQLSTVLLIGIGGIVAGILLGFSAMFIIPVMLLWAFITLFVFPFSFLLDPSMPPMIIIPLTVILNAITGLALLNFIRGPT